MIDPDRFIETDDLDKRTLHLIESIARQISDSIEQGRLPAMSFPVRSLSNVTYDAERGHFELGKHRKCAR